MSLLPEAWLARVAVKKAIYGIVKGAVGVLTYTKSQAVLHQLGINVDMEAFQSGLTALMLAGASALHDWAKLKWPNSQWL